MIILIILIALGALALLAFAAGTLRNHHLKQQLKRGEIKEMPQIITVDSECCGQHETCEKDSLLAAVSKGIEYYNDEELDRYRGIAPDAYQPDSIEEFREVLYTMRDDEVAGWVRSLQLRGLNLPDALKDEVFLIIGERRMQ